MKNTKTNERTTFGEVSMDETLKQKAEEYRASHTHHAPILNVTLVNTSIEEAYIAGATENGIQWHNLRKDPNDLPKDTYDGIVY